ncbi:hypothetical protein R3I93_004654 [Phoxinus phoxinus]|uniref:Uncharacterized protein n=1 Tax=Phoxinus phoxinus TaxID=58324 RepID=A0AAN9DJG1_9TELE
MEHRRLFDAALEGPERGSPSKEPSSGKRPLKARAPKSPEEELSSGSTTPERTRLEYKESGTSSPESSDHEEEALEKGGSEGEAVGGSEGEAVGGSEGEAVGSPREQEPQGPSTPPRKYPDRRGKATVLLTPLKSLASSQRHVSPLKVKKAVFSPSSTTLVDMSRRKKATERVRKAMKNRRPKR